jgi:hypothetical protein
MANRLKMAVVETILIAPLRPFALHKELRPRWRDLSVSTGFHPDAGLGHQKNLLKSRASNAKHTFAAARPFRVAVPRAAAPRPGRPRALGVWSERASHFGVCASGKEGEWTVDLSLQRS